ncbi:MAG: type II toxin-antitoxin system VapC family toxin [Lautropia sp.]|nr:type II toxin-antitoxin system VapC family toxin [Lautropia sp.]
MFLLDTNVVSETRKSRPHGGVMTWLASVDESRLFLSAVTIGEIQRGIELTRQQDSQKALELTAWLDAIIESQAVLPMGAGTFRLVATLMHRKSDTLYEDAMIAATALERELTVVTRNVQDFREFGVPLFNPFS